jgi:hypothetical protein
VTHEVTASPDMGPRSRSREVKNVEILAVELMQELDASRLAVVSLLAVITDEQFMAVETALMSVAQGSETSRAALEELRTARSRQRLAREEDSKAPKRSTVL